VNDTLRVVPLTWLPGSHDLRSDYVEHCWLPVLGPSAFCLLRRIGEYFDAYPDGFDLDLNAAAIALGLSGRAQKVRRTCERLVLFQVAQPHGNDVLAVRTLLPPLPFRKERQLPLTLLARSTT